MQCYWWCWWSVCCNDGTLLLNILPAPRVRPLLNNCLTRLRSWIESNSAVLFFSTILLHFISVCHQTKPHPYQPHTQSGHKFNSPWSFYRTAPYYIMKNTTSLLLVLLSCYWSFTFVQPNPRALYTLISLLISELPSPALASLVHLSSTSINKAKVESCVCSSSSLQPILPFGK